ncbi:MAG: hypothetical protein AAFU65_14875, partial [Pseudomonadota bacterium]
ASQQLPGRPEQTATAADTLEATLNVARTARRSICLFSHNLEPVLFGRQDFVEIVKGLILTHKFARVRILIKSPMRCVQEGHRLVDLAQRFSSFVEIRVAHRDDQGRRDTFLVADQRAVVCRAQSDRFEGIADTRTAAVALHYLEFFDTAWERAESSGELRRLYL